MALEFLNAGVPALLSAGIHIRAGTVHPLAALFAPVPIWIWVDMAWFWGGRRFGSRVASWALRHADIERTVARAESLISRRGSWVVGLAPWLPVPAILLYAAAGWTRLAFGRYLFAYLIGTLGRTAAILAIGYAVGSSGESALHAVQHWANLITGAIAVALFLGLVLVFGRRWRRRRSAA